MLTRLAGPTGLMALLLATGAATPLVTLADPPPWAPAHGARDKHGDRDDEESDERREEHHERGRHHKYRGYEDRGWDNDYGVSTGRCNRAAVGAVLGGVVGGAIGAEVAHNRDRPVAIIVGALLGSLVGHEIGRDMDDSDRGCMGHALELARDGRPVTWRNESTGVAYIVTPVRPWREGGPACREFRLRTTAGGRHGERTAFACRAGDGEWRLRDR